MPIQLFSLCKILLHVPPFMAKKVINFKTALSRLTSILINVFLQYKEVELCHFLLLAFLYYKPFLWALSPLCCHCSQSFSRLPENSHYLGHQSKLRQKRNLGASKACTQIAPASRCLWAGQTPLSFTGTTQCLALNVSTPTGSHRMLMAW